MGDRTTFDSLIANVARVEPTEPAAALIGEVFGSYRVVSQLGAGGMGWVFLAEHAVLGSRAAIKVLKPTHSQQQALVQRFFDEARAATRVADPSIVTVLDFGWHPSGAAYLVMEYLTGETLARRVRSIGRLAPAQALAIVRQCAIAMAAAHARGIVHRDLKPDNIFVVPDLGVGTERIKILDFGIAKLLGEGDASHGGTHSGMILGTPGYMSPEQCRGAGQVDHRTDVYALGCVLFFLLTGRPPFVASTPGDLIALHITAPAPTPSSLMPGITPAVDRLVAHCLAKDAKQRIASMTDLIAAIDAVGVPLASALALGSTPTPGPAIELAPTIPSQPIPRSRRGLAVAAGLVVGAAAIATVILATRTDDRTTAPAGSAADPAPAHDPSPAPPPPPHDPSPQRDPTRSDPSPQPNHDAPTRSDPPPRPKHDTSTAKHIVAKPPAHDEHTVVPPPDAATPVAPPPKGSDDPYDRR